MLTAITGTAPETLTAIKTSDTFAAETDVDVTAGTAQAVTLTLDRIVAKLTVSTTDTYPADCNTLDVALDEYPTIRLADLSVIGRVGNHRITDVSANVGKVGHKVSYFVLAPTDGYTTDIAITPTRQSGGDYQSVTITDVPLERNKVTTITGSIYGHAKGVKVAVNDEWNADGNAVDF